MGEVGLWIAFGGGMFTLAAATVALVGSFHLFKLKAGSPTFDADLRTQDRLLDAAGGFLLIGVPMVLLGALVVLVAGAAAMLS